MSYKALNFDWNRVKAFLIAAQEGSLSAAARAMGVAQPTLGRQVSALEQELNVTLFERVPHGLALTQSGLELIEAAKAMGVAANDLSLIASGQSQLLEGTVCISASELDASTYLPPVLKKIRAQEPGIIIEVVVSNQASDLQRREADIALRNFRPTQPDLIARKLREEPVWMYGSKKYIQSLGSPDSPKDLSDVSIIGYERTDQYLNLFNQVGFNLTQENIHLVSQNYTMQCSMMKQGLGLGLLSQYIGDHESGLVRAFENFGPLVSVPLWLVCHRELHTNLRVRKVFDVIVDQLQTE